MNQFRRMAWMIWTARRRRRHRRCMALIASNRDVELWNLLEDEQRREDDRMIARICAALEDAGYVAKSARSK